MTTSRDHTVACGTFLRPRARHCRNGCLTLSKQSPGRSLNEQGVLEETTLDRVETLNRIRNELEQNPRNDDWTIWGRWFLADPATRNISPFSRITVPDIFKVESSKILPKSLEEAERLALRKC